MSASLTFNFQEAVARARRDYPEEARHITFVDLSKSDAKREIKTFVKQHIPFQLFSSKRRQEIKYLLSTQFGRYSTYIATTLPANVVKKSSILLVESEPRSDCLMQGSKDRKFCFNHELGHIVVPNGHNIVSVHRREVAADTFATLHGLHDGDMTLDDASHIAARRAAKAYYNGDIEHMTTAALDRLILNKEGLDFISLTPQQIKAIADDYAQKFGITDEKLRRIITGETKGIDNFKAAFRP